MKKISPILFLCIVALFCVLSCETFEPVALDDSALLDGPVADLSAAENIQFLRGDVSFNDQVFNSSNGLGPLFVSTSCGS